jgi:hypothetical protein
MNPNDDMKVPQAYLGHGDSTRVLDSAGILAEIDVHKAPDYDLSCVRKLWDTVVGCPMSLEILATENQISLMARSGRERPGRHRGRQGTLYLAAPMVEARLRERFLEADVGRCRTGRAMSCSPLANIGPGRKGIRADRHTSL